CFSTACRLIFLLCWHSRTGFLKPCQLFRCFQHRQHVNLMPQLPYFTPCLRAWRRLLYVLYQLSLASQNDVPARIERWTTTVSDQPPCLRIALLIARCRRANMALRLAASRATLTHPGLAGPMPGTHLSSVAHPGSVSPIVRGRLVF